MAGAGLGAAIGSVAGFVVPLVAARLTSRSLLSHEVITLLLAPGAYMVSWMTGWPMQQESALLCYGFSFILTPLALGALIGGALGWVMGAQAAPNRDART